jgi:hypothetical protein
MESREIFNEVNRIASGVNNELNDYYESLRNSIALNKAKAQSATDKSRKVRPCPILNEIKDITETDRQMAISTIKSIEKVIRENKDDYGGVDVSERGDDTGSSESGSDIGRETTLINVGMPKWIQEIENSVKSKLTRVKKREYFDVEGLMRGVTRKKKEKGMKRIDYVYFLLDVSGSMIGFSYKGVPLITLFASYVPAIAKKFEGLWLQVDGGKVIPNDLKKIGKNEIKTLILGGGGGANFDEAVEWIKEDISSKGITNPVVVMASDSHEDFDFELLPNTIYITTEEGWRWTEAGNNGLIAQGFPNKLKGQKAIIIDID